MVTQIETNNVLDLDVETSSGRIKTKVLHPEYHEMDAWTPAHFLAEIYFRTDDRDFWRRQGNKEKAAQAQQAKENLVGLDQNVLKGFTD